MFLSEIPGYKRACERADRLEDYWRDYAFLGLDEELQIAGGRKVAVRLLTLRMFIELCAVRSPFMVGGRVGPEHVAQILWRLSPGYGGKSDVEGQTARQKFVAEIADLPFKSSVRAISRFLDRMLIDKPPQPVRNTGAKSDTSFAASMIHSLAKEYSWTANDILDLPMPSIFQYLRKIQRSHDPELSFWNPLRDSLPKKVTDKFLANLNANRADRGLPVFGDENQNQNGDAS